MHIEPIPDDFTKGLVRFDNVEERSTFGANAPYLRSRESLRYLLDVLHVKYYKEAWPQEAVVPNQVIYRVAGNLAVEATNDEARTIVEATSNYLGRAVDNIRNRITEGESDRTTL